MRTEQEAVLVTVSVPDETLAATLAETLLREHRVACTQTIGPIRSQYHWQGSLASTSEFLLVLKTQRSHLEALEAIILASHPYDVPEILVTAIEAGHAPYLEWLQRETTSTNR